jgi:hypothetical protein
LFPLAVVQIASIGCGVIGVRWSSTVVPPAAFGVFGVLLSAQQLAMSVTHQGFVKHVQRYWTPTTSASEYLAALSGSWLRPLLILLAGLAIATGYFAWATNLPVPPIWWAWLAAVNLLTVGAAIAQGALQAEERYWAGGAASITTAAARSFLPPLFVTLGTSALAMLGTGYLLHAIVSLGVFLWMLHPAWRRRDQSAAAIPPAQPLVNTFMQVGALAWVAAMAPRWFAASTLSADQTGYFILSTNLTMVVPASASVVGQNYSFPPLFAAARDRAPRRKLWSITLLAVAATLVATEAGLLVLAWCAPALIGPIIAARYAPATVWILGAGGAVLATLSGPLFCNLLIATAHDRFCVWLTAISAAVRVAIMAAAAATHDPHALRVAFVALPFPTLVVEWAVTWWVMRKPAAVGAVPVPV